MLEPEKLKEMVLKMIFNVNDMETAREGFEIVHDMRTLSFSKFSARVPAALAKILGFLPFRLKAAYIVDAPWMMRGALTVARNSVMPSWLKPRVYTINFADVGKYFDKEELPTFLGGINEETFEIQDDILNAMFMNQTSI